MYYIFISKHKWLTRCFQIKKKIGLIKIKCKRTNYKNNNYIFNEFILKNIHKYIIEDVKK